MTVHTSNTGRGGPSSPEEDALTAILKTLNASPFEAVMWCGYRRFEEILEIVSSLESMLSREQRRVFLKTARKSGAFLLNGMQETIATRTGIAYELEPKIFRFAFSPRLSPDEVLVLPYKKRTVH